jgi:hypothetical protein
MNPFELLIVAWFTVVGAGAAFWAGAEMRRRRR